MLEGDSFHPPENITKMAAGIPLTDTDRAPWLAALGREIGWRIAAGEQVVASCSALKPEYRAALREGVVAAVAAAIAATAVAQGAMHGGSSSCSSGPGIDGGGDGFACAATASSKLAFVLLAPSRAELEQRLGVRAAAGNHFMPAGLLDSQLATLHYQPSEFWARFDENMDPFPSPEMIVAALAARLRGGSAHSARGSSEGMVSAQWLEPGCQQRQQQSPQPQLHQQQSLHSL